MTYEEAKAVFSDESKDVGVLEFELALHGSLQDIACFKQLIKELVGMYHALDDWRLTVEVHHGILSTKQICFSDSIFSCLGKLVGSASYGVFKDCLLNGELRKAIVDMQQTYLNHAPTIYGCKVLSSKLRKLEQLIVAAAAKARRKPRHTGAHGRRSPGKKGRDEDEPSPEGAYILDFPRRI